MQRDDVFRPVPAKTYPDQIAAGQQIQIHATLHRLFPIRPIVLDQLLEQMDTDEELP